MIKTKFYVKFAGDTDKIIESQEKFLNNLKKHKEYNPNGWKVSDFNFEKIDVSSEEWETDFQNDGLIEIILTNPESEWNYKLLDTSIEKITMLLGDSLILEECLTVLFYISSDDMYFGAQVKTNNELFGYIFEDCHEGMVDCAGSEISIIEEWMNYCPINYIKDTIQTYDFYNDL